MPQTYALHKFVLLCFSDALFQTRREVFPSFCATFFCDWALVNLAVSGGRATAATRRRARAEAAEAGDDGSVITLVSAEEGREGDGRGRGRDQKNDGSNFLVATRAAVSLHVAWQVAF